MPDAAGPGGASVLYPTAKEGKGIAPGLLALLIICILLLVAAMAYALFRLKRYRTKLDKHKSHIERGRKQWELDQMEKDVTFAANPTVGNIDELRSKARAFMLLSTIISRITTVAIEGYG